MAFHSVLLRSIVFYGGPVSKVWPNVRLYKRTISPLKARYSIPRRERIGCVMKPQITDNGTKSMNRYREIEREKGQEPSTGYS